MQNVMLSSYILHIIYTFFSSFKIDFARNPDFTSLTKRAVERGTQIREESFSNENQALPTMTNLLALPIG